MPPAPSFWRRAYLRERLQESPRSRALTGWWPASVHSDPEFSRALQPIQAFSDNGFCPASDKNRCSTLESRPRAPPARQRRRRMRTQEILNATAVSAAIKRCAPCGRDVGSNCVSLHASTERSHCFRAFFSGLHCATSCCNCCCCARARSSAMNKRLCWYAVWTTDKAHPISATSNTILRRLINSDSFLSQLLGAAHHGRTRAHVRFAFSIARADARPQLKRGRWLCGRAQRQITQRSAGLRRARMGLHKAFDNSVFK